MQTPLGIDDPRPSLGWQLRSTERGTAQSAYRIEVAESEAQLESGDLVWDSGQTASPESVSVPYAGPALASRGRYFWRVRVWDEHSEASAWSPPSWWEMALGTLSSWDGAEWITPEAATEASTWTDYRVDTDFTIATGAAGVAFRAQDPSDFYMWQVKIEDEGSPGEEVLLRPHVQQAGEWSVLDEVDINDVITPAAAHEQHHLTIEAKGDTITTFVDGEEVDVLEDDTFSAGGIGFRSGDGSEDASFDQLEIHDLEDHELFSDEFGSDPDAAFPGAEISGGALRVHGSEVRLISTTPPAPELRKEFALKHSPAEITSARIYAIGLGLYEMGLSGARVGDRVLAPPATGYSKRLRYQTYDVTSLLRGGETQNAIGMTLAEGYGPRFSKYGWRWLGPREARVLLDIHYEDGDEQQVISDDSWRWSEGAVREATLYGGETYDATAADDWDEPGFDDDGWAPVKAATPPAGSLEADATPPIRVVETLHPVGLSEPEDGVYVFDLGRNVSGWARIRVPGDAGTVRLRYAEEIEPDGTLDTTTNRNAAATDTFIPSGDPGEETFEPEFTYHGFRYVELSGLPSSFEPTLDTLEGRVVRADVPVTSEFESSDPMLNRIYANNRWTMENNMVSYPTDNPVRDERTGPGMDMQAYVDAAVRDFGDDRFLAAFLDQLEEEWGGSPDMNLAHIPIAWALYEQYGDRAALAAAYPSMTAALDNYVNETEATGGVWPEPPPGEHEGFGDWCPPVPAGAVDGGVGGTDLDVYEECFSEVSLVNTALAYRDARVVATAAEALDHATDATHFDSVAEAIESTFESTFGNAGAGYGSERQVTGILPLAFGMIGAGARREDVARALIERIEDEEPQMHLDTGIFGTRFLLDALVAADRPELALTMLDQTSYPGFGFEIEFGPQIGLPPGHGATTDWEAWAYHSDKASHDHAMFAGINASFVTKLAGIEPRAPGYAEIAIAPVVPAGLGHAAATLQTVRGEIASSWTRDGDSIGLDVTVPANATAEVSVPTNVGDEVLESGTPAAASPGVTYLRDEGSTSVYEVGSGEFRFVAAPAAESEEEPKEEPSGEEGEKAEAEEPSREYEPGGGGGTRSAGDQGAQEEAPAGSETPAPSPPSRRRTHRGHRHRPRLAASVRSPSPRRLLVVLRCRSACPVRRRPAVLVVTPAGRRRPVLARRHARISGARTRIVLRLPRPLGAHRLRIEVRGLGRPVVLAAKLPLSAPSSAARAAPGVRPPGRRA
jgi:alpha-L-rhamnosidase